MWLIKGLSKVSCSSRANSNPLTQIYDLCVVSVSYNSVFFEEIRSMRKIRSHFKSCLNSSHISEVSFRHSGKNCAEWKEMLVYSEMLVYAEGE